MMVSLLVVLPTNPLPTLCTTRHYWGFFHFNTPCYYCSYLLVKKEPPRATVVGALSDSLGYRLFLNSSRNAVAISLSVTPASKSSFAIFLSVYPALILSMTHALNCRVSLPRTLPTLLLIFHPNLLIFRSLQFCFVLFIFNSNYTQYIIKFSSWKK